MARHTPGRVLASLWRRRAQLITANGKTRYRLGDPFFSDESIRNIKRPQAACGWVVENRVAAPRRIA